MLAIEGTYYDGKVNISKNIKTNIPVRVIITFLDEKISDFSQKLTRDKFNFDKTREMLKNVSTSFSDTLIEERKRDL